MIESVLAVGFCLSLASRLHRLLLFFQQEEYQRIRFLRWCVRNLGRSIGVVVPAILIVSALAVVADVSGASNLVVALGSIGVICASELRSRGHAAKKPLTWTKRARLMWLAAVLLGTTLGAASVVRWDGATVNVADTGAFQIMLLAAVILTAPIILVCGDLMIFPIVRRWHLAVIRDAHEQLGIARPRIVGVTGSYGKTSTKEITAQLLGIRYRTAKTPGSYNTLLGLASAIRDGLIRDKPAFLVAEYGAYRRGEIDRMTRLARPDIAIITAIGPQHLERFGSLEAITEAKFELLRAVPPEGLVVINADDERCYALRTRVPSPSVTFSWRVPRADSFVWATDVEMSAAGLNFVIRLHDGRSAHSQTRLLGSHNVSNILAGSAVALNCGITLEEIVTAIAALRPVTHRLELKQGSGGVTIIDDSYNSNPAGAANALDTLAEFSGGRRFLVTPGLVELGREGPTENQRLGRLAAARVDEAILVGGASTRALVRGLREGGFDDDRLSVVPNLAAATELLRSKVRRGDTVLLMNDLPDLYET
ncbi:MAG: UDP-N-acetylmuramoyl-tripeptide--D-alanyl-D-alanine ligase [Chloroflexi bacterium]|nr:UDP-N-acetylmuramoyl-tripeptide--D-alanyl-D-alanine ligase [Chloroflexota bacterium]